MRSLLGLLAIIAVLILAIAYRPTEDVYGLSPDQVARVGYLGVILLMLVGALGTAYRHRLSAALSHFVLWLGLFTALIAGHTYRVELKLVLYRSLAAVVPGLAVPAAEAGSVIVAKSGDGHFHISATIDAKPVRVVVDTGATTVTLRAEDARRLGIAPTEADYTVTTSTANGTSRAAPVTLTEIVIGDISVRNVRALVARPGALDINLLGNSFLERLSSFTVEGDRLILRQ